LWARESRIQNSEGKKTRRKVAFQLLLLNSGFWIPLSVVKEIVREIITFECTQCKSRNYTSTKNKKGTTERLELKKFCRRCRAHTLHKETR